MGNFLIRLLRAEVLIALVGTEIALLVAFVAWSLVLMPFAVLFHLPWWTPGAFGALLFWMFYRAANRRRRWQ